MTFVYVFGGCIVELQQKYNTVIAALAMHFEAFLVDQANEGTITAETCHSYCCDSIALHPNSNGHKQMETVILHTMMENFSKEKDNR